MYCKYCKKQRGKRFRVIKIVDGKTYYRKKCNVCVSEMNKKRRHDLKKKLDKIKSKKKCEICGFDDGRALQYHHRKGEQKVTEIGNMVNRGFTLENVIKEIDKCQCLCANCHQIFHHEQRKSNNKV